MQAGMGVEWSGTGARKAARAAGVLYLLIIAGGLFAEIFVREALTVAGDPAATAAGILSGKRLYRLGFTVHLSYLLCAVPVALILYGLLGRVNSGIALLALLFNVIAIAVEAVNLLNQFAPLRILGAEGMQAFSEGQLESLAYLFPRLFSSGFGISLTFFGVFCLFAGFLIYQSRFLPRFLGVLMGLAGACYLVNSYSVFLAPGFAALLFPYILLPCLVGELAFALWLTVRGVNARAWEEAGIKS